jgi:hypothetical protein
VSFDALRALEALVAEGTVRHGTGVAVAWAMANRASVDTGELWASTRDLAAFLGMSQGTAWREMRGLVAAGVTEVLPGRAHWRWRVVAPPATASAPGVDNGAARRVAVSERYPDASPVEGTRRVSEHQRLTTGALPTREGSQTRTRYINQDGGGCENEHELPPALRDGVHPAEVPERVAELREALGGRRGVAPASHPQPPAAPVLSLVELTEFMAGEE